jgi:hypothetical protein
MKLLYPIFDNYFEALEKLNFGPDTFIVQINDHPNSLEFMSNNKQLVKVLGTGKMKHFGFPAGHQEAGKQTLFMKTLINNSQVPVLHMYENGIVEYLGFYRHLFTKIKLTDRGFKYYEYTLQRYNKS